MEPENNVLSLHYDPDSLLRRTGDLLFDEDDFKSALGQLLFSIDWCVRTSDGQEVDKDDVARSGVFRSIVRQIPSPRR